MQKYLNLYIYRDNVVFSWEDRAFKETAPICGVIRWHLHV